MRKRDIRYLPALVRAPRRIGADIAVEWLYVTRIFARRRLSFHVRLAYGFTGEILFMATARTISLHARTIRIFH